MRELDWIQVKGREAPLAVFEPLIEREKATGAQIDCASRFAEALALYRTMRFNQAYAIWNALAEEEASSFIAHDGKGDLAHNPSGIMAERAKAFLANPPANSWDGVWILTSK